MARPIKVGLSYFPLDTTFFTNEKIKNLRRKHGAIGILTYLNILCKVYGKNGYYFSIPGGDKESFYMDIAEEIASGNDQIRQVTSRVRETIHHLLEQGMLDRDLFEKDVISGIALQEQYVLSATRSRQQVRMDMYCLVDVREVARKNRVIVAETGVITEETGVNATLSTQKKEKEIKTNIHSFNLAREGEEQAPSEGDRMEYINGKIGGGYVFMSENQMEDLLGRMSIDEFNKYVSIVRDCEMSGKHYHKSHYQAILDMVEADRRTKEGNKQ